MWWRDLLIQCEVIEKKPRTRSMTAKTHLLLEYLTLSSPSLLHAHCVCVCSHIKWHPDPRGGAHEFGGDGANSAAG